MSAKLFLPIIKVRVRKDAADFFYYPDVTVDCSGSLNGSLFAGEPRVIFEVLSPDTERIDRGEKLRNFQAIPSLDVYVLVDQFHVAVTIDCALLLEAIYERTGL